MNIVIMCCPGREAMVHRLRESLPGAIVLEVWDAQREGNVPCALRAFEMGLAAFRGQPFTVLQDDAELCAGFVDYVDSFTKDVRDLDLVIQWYAHAWVTEKRTFGTGYPPHFFHCAADEYICSIATTYSPKWAEKIAARLADAVENDPRDDHGQLHGDDAAIAQTLAFHGGTFWVHVPSLVQHIGHVSMVAGRKVSLASHDARQSRCYVGRGFDARSLLTSVHVPWRDTKEKTMDDTMNPEVTPTAPVKVDPVVGLMTVSELYAALKELANAEKDDNGQALALEHAQEVTGKERMKSWHDLPMNAAVPPMVPVVCNECGADVGACGHE